MKPLDSSSSISAYAFFGVIATLVVAVVLAIAFGILYLEGWLVYAVFNGFGVAVPFWPCVGGVLVFNFFLSPVFFRSRA